MKLNLEIRRVKLNEVKSKKESIHAFASILKLKKNQQYEIFAKSAEIREFTGT